MHNIMQSPNTGVGGSAHGGNYEKKQMPWERDIKGNPPPEGIEVELLCSWYGGEFVMRGTRVNYKQGSKKQKSGFRFVASGERIKERPEAWRFKT